jgi:hypothetical protein
MFDSFRHGHTDLPGDAGRFSLPVEITRKMDWKWINPTANSSIDVVKSSSPETHTQQIRCTGFSTPPFFLLQNPVPFNDLATHPFAELWVGEAAHPFFSGRSSC